MNSNGFSSFLPSTSNFYQNSLSILNPIVRPATVRLRDFPLDLRYRPVLTPPSTPSPPKKKIKSFNESDRKCEQNVTKSNKNFFSNTISIDDKKYFQNSYDFSEVEVKKINHEIQEDLIDVTSSDNEMVNDKQNKYNNEIYINNNSNLTEDSSHHDNNDKESEISDEIDIDVESNDDSIIFGETVKRDEIVNNAILQNGKTVFEDRKHLKQ
jgi:hypothetical protein